VDDVIVLLDFGEIGSIAEARELEEFLEIATQIRHFGDLGARALEVPVVDGIEANEGGIEPDVGFGDVLTDKVALFA